LELKDTVYHGLEIFLRTNGSLSFSTIKSLDLVSC
jgi:hypothetical protein